MSALPLRVALVGCGRIARTHCRYLRATEAARLVAVCDPIEEAARGLARECRLAGHFFSLDRMLSEIRPDVVHVLTPPATHADVAVAAMNGGAHVLVEKPMAITGLEADAMLAAAKRTGRVLAVDHNRWFDPPVQQAVGLLDSGDLGELVGVDVFQGAAVDEMKAIVSGAKSDWRSSLPGGIMHDLAAHPAYLLLNLIGEVQTVNVGARRENEVLQDLRVVAGGRRALGSLTISMRARPFMNTLRLMGTRLSADVNLNNMTLIVRRGHHGSKVLGKVLPNLDEAAQLVTSTVRNTLAFVAGRQRYFPGMGILIDRFYRHLTTGASAPTTGEDGRAVAKFLDTVWARASEAVGNCAHA